jgi:GNAT superfamily N-acetyltransferase
MMAEPSHIKLLAEVQSEQGSAIPVGYVRINSVGEVSIAVAPDQQGKGIGRALLVAATMEAAKAGVLALIARIKPGNSASIRLFEQDGYRHADNEEIEGQSSLRYLKRITSLQDGTEPRSP